MFPLHLLFLNDNCSVAEDREEVYTLLTPEESTDATNQQNIPNGTTNHKQTVKDSTNHQHTNHNHPSAVVTYHKADTADRSSDFARIILKRQDNCLAEETEEVTTLISRGGLSPPVVEDTCTVERSMDECPVALPPNVSVLPIIYLALLAQHLLELCFL